MEVILSTAFGVKSETQTVENDPITEKAKKALAPNPISALMSQYKACFRHDVLNQVALLPYRTQFINY